MGDFDGDGKDDILVVDVAQGDWQVARSLSNSFQPVTIAFKPWGANVEMQAFVGHLSGNKKASQKARYMKINSISFGFQSPHYVNTHIIKLGLKPILISKRGERYAK